MGQVRTHDAQNRVTGVGRATAPAHSDNGEMTLEDTGQALAYDAWGRLVSAGTSSYAYDALFRRIAQDGRRLYYSQQWQVLEEHTAATGSATLHTRHVWSAVYVDAHVLRDRDINNDGTIPATGGEGRRAGEAQLSSKPGRRRVCSVPWPQPPLRRRRSG